jgi:bacillolysin
MRVHRPSLSLSITVLCATLLLPAITNGQTFKQQVIDAHRASVSAPPSENLGRQFTLWQKSNDVLRRHEVLRYRGLRIDQILSYDALASSIPQLTVQWDEAGTPIYLSGEPLQRSRSTFTAGNVHEATAHAFFEHFASLLDISDSRETFVPTSARRDESGRTHLRFAQLRSGVPVHGKEVICGLMANGDMDLFMGRFAPASRPSTGSFTLSADNAIGKARTHVAPLSDGDHPHVDPALLAHDGKAQAERCWYDDGKSLQAAYFVELHPNIHERWQVMVRADDGAVLRAFNAVCGDGPEKALARDLLGQTRSIDTYLHQGSYYMIDATRPMFDSGNSVLPDRTYGTILTLTANNSDLQTVSHVISSANTWNDASSVSAHHFASVVYEYFRDTHGRNSIDGQGGTIISVVNVTNGGRAMENAFWNGKIMAYGNGGPDFEPFAKSLDIAAHEMTHGVTEHTSGLEYLNQSGALNEAFSDIFAAMVDRDDWLLGEDITKVSTNFPNGALRSMEDPHNGTSPGALGWQPKHMNEYQNLPESQDNGGVHVNSGIINHSAYLLAQQIGREKVEKIFYNALTTKLTRQARFIDYRLAIIRSAQELYGATEANACAAACNQVGLTDGNPTDKPGDYEPVDGIDRLLFTNTDPSFPAPLWIVVPPATNDQDFSSVSFTNVWSRPSVSDDGSVAVFVSDEFNIHAISLIGDPNEQVLDNSGIWNSIALSHDKNLLAVTTITLVPEVYVIDISGPTPMSKSFAIYTPNYTGESIPNSARFVDAMEFSLDDESLLFDVYNEVTVSGYEYGFWDINLMAVWDNAADNYGSGHIVRIFPQEPAMNLGNPTFAKTKPTVIAFDAQFQLDGESYVLALDMLQGEPSLVASVPFNTFGYPNYSGNDGTLSFVVSDPNMDIVFNVSMAADGVTPAGTPQGFIPGAIWPVWFRSGSRPVSAEQPPLPMATTLDQNYPNPFNPSTTIRYRLGEPGVVRLTVHDALGRVVATLTDGWVDAGEHSVSWNGRDTGGQRLPSGLYVARLFTDGTSITRQMLLLK